MVFSSTVFLFLFFPLVLILYYLPPLRQNRAYRNTLLLVFSLIFYAWGEPLFVFLMLFSILVTFMIGLMETCENRKTAKLFLTAGILYHVVILVVFKYLSFFSQELNRMIGINSSRIDIALPIGISFFTFQMMSYLFDVWYGKAKVQRNLLNLALYVSLFPQLIAGPIVRYETVEMEIMNRKESWEDFSVGIRRFVIGLGKKALIADFLAVTADNVYALAHVGPIPALTAWLGAIAYMLQIYFDFSGYSDMAIGLGLCFGFHFKENFRAPYLADSIVEFWRRWHISLTDWFRDYVYIPLGGNRCGIGKQLRNTVVVWLLTGIWHGANWTFLLWGGLYCCVQLAERYVYHPAHWPKYLRHFYTLLVICLLWVVFRSVSIRDAFSYLHAMVGGNALYDETSLSYLRSSAVILVLSTVCCLPAGSRLKQIMVARHSGAFVEILTGFSLVFILLMASVFSISGGYSPFIYFNF
ncbi:MAG: MBOAT family protein [Oscillospiraceae bacterium]|nr:MBOAT family protein [Oscillospiraceae bacterium]